MYFEISRLNDFRLHGPIAAVLAALTCLYFSLGNPRVKKGALKSVGGPLSGKDISLRETGILKAAFCLKNIASRPVVRMFREHSPIIVAADVSDVGLGAVL